jgi:hypothetical protein
MMLLVLCTQERIMCASVHLAALRVEQLMVPCSALVSLESVACTPPYATSRVLQLMA